MNNTKKRSPKRTEQPLLLHGVTSAMARKLECTQPLISLVRLGIKRSAMVQRELDRYYRNPHAWYRRNQRFFVVSAKAA